MSQGGRYSTLFWCLMVLGASALPAFAQGGAWVNFTNETALRFPSGSTGSSDTQEKDYAWGDLDMDGDTDLVCVRKEPFTTPGRRANVLFMNEGGIFVDRTADYATASTVPGDLGFQTATNDRDVQVADLTGDGLLDIITATTLSDNQPLHISHPRVYVNLGFDTGGDWLGFQYDDSRIPQLGGMNGSFPDAPRFCSVAVGDIDDDGDLDLYFGDYDSGPTQSLDFNNRLLINDGTGTFTDETLARLTFQMRQSAFGAASEIHDMNGDGAQDVVKQTSLVAPQHVAVTYNNPDNEGFFNTGSGGYDIVYTQAPYFVEVGDLNNDGMHDMIITDDGPDRILINTGNGGDGFANFSSYVFSFQSGGDSGFGGNSYIADFDNDGWNDVYITDVDVDILGCARTSALYHNQGNTPLVTMLEENGTGAYTPTGVHDVAVLDINGDGWLDMVLGRCVGTVVWINEPPELEFSRGDVNADGNFDITDPVVLLNYLFNNGAEPVCLDAADGDDSGSHGLTDVFAILNALFGAPTTPLPAPYPGCGVDPTGDSLGCDSSPGC